MRERPICLMASGSLVSFWLWRRLWLGGGFLPSAAQPGRQRHFGSLRAGLIVCALGESIGQIRLQALRWRTHRIRWVRGASVAIVRVDIALAIVLLAHQARRRVA